MEMNLEHMESLRNGITEGKVPSFDGMDPEVLSSVFKGTTLLHSAVLAENIAAVRQLLKKEVWFEVLKGKTPLDLAIAKSNPEMVIALGEHKIIKPIAQEPKDETVFSGPFKELNQAVSDGRLNTENIDFGLIRKLALDYTKNGKKDVGNFANKLSSALQLSVAKTYNIMNYIGFHNDERFRYADNESYITNKLLDYLDSNPKDWPVELGKSHIIAKISDGIIFTTLDLSRFTTKEIADGLLSSKFPTLTSVFSYQDNSKYNLGRLLSVLKSMKDNEFSRAEISDVFINKLDLDILKEMTRVGMVYKLRSRLYYNSLFFDDPNMIDKIIDSGINIKIDNDFKIELTLRHIDNPIFEKLKAHGLAFSIDDDEFEPVFNHYINHSDYKLNYIFHNKINDGVISAFHKGYKISISDVERVIKETWSMETIPAKSVANVARGFGLIDKPILDGKTLLMSASASRHVERVTALLEKGANPYIQNEDGKTAMAMTGNPTSPAGRTMKTAVVELLARAMIDNPHLKVAAEADKHDPMDQLERKSKKFRA